MAGVEFAPRFTQVRMGSRAGKRPIHQTSIDERVAPAVSGRAHVDGMVCRLPKKPLGAVVTGIAALIVLLAGLTQWVRWEMRQIVELGYSRKLIILMPELSGWKHRKRRLRSDIAGKRLEAIRETFSGSPWEAGINEPCVVSSFAPH